jgi:OOP family OmpA-OmpF porin
MMRFPGLSKDNYYHRGIGSSGVVLLSAEYRFNKIISLRSELGFADRGGSLHYRNVLDVSSGVYTMKTTYFDIRVPVIFDIPIPNTKFAPYVYVAPVVSFVAGGWIKTDETMLSGEVRPSMLSLSNGNIAAAHFAAEVGAGVRYPVRIAGHECHVSFEVGYEYGFTNTYSKKERENASVSVNTMQGAIVGPRKNSGFELKLGIQVPLNIFCKRSKPQEVVVEKVVEKVVVEKVVEEKVVDMAVESPQVADDVASRTKPCYTLQEIQTMVNAGMDVHGLTICAVEDINFTSGQSTITEDSIVYLKQVANILIETGLFVEVRGHTDNVGRDADNLELSKERAKAVADYLVRRGVPQDKIVYQYYGESRPLVSNDTPEGRKLNRRVEFHLVNR